MAVKLDYTFAADAIAAKGGVPPSLVSALVNAESSWNPAAVSSTGCTGLGQFCQAAAKDYGLMGDGFDNRKDAALNLTAIVKYLADLKKNNPTWREVIRHYSGQTSALEGYARYSAGQLLIMIVDALDGTEGAPPPPGGDPGPTIVIDSIAGHDQSTGHPVTFIT
jgi:soluble lytic murein transglycosylase-like protein